MLIYIYLLFFWIFAVLYIIFKSIQLKEIRFENKTIQNLANTTSTALKGIPTAIGVFFVFLTRPNDSLFYLILIGALAFCLFGDYVIDKGFLPGLVLFLFAQILFSLAFITQALTLGISLETAFLVVIISIIIFSYVILFFRYLDSSEEGLGKFKIPVILYCVVISLMLLSSFLLWIASGRIELIVVVLGAISFVISDSFIGIREFHHPIKKNVIKIMSTYYLAIFLFSVSVLVVVA
ncbi:MAG: lysoplasmalogenase family protein [Candidatus Hodarchaeales archaeon]|jgi:uncharacterized membrane protein YhhN